jgi:hypothetical protein
MTVTMGDPFDAEFGPGEYVPDITTDGEPEGSLRGFDEIPSDIYRYFVFDILTDNILGELKINNVNFSLKLNSVGDFSGTINAVDVQDDINLFTATMPMKTALYVLRDNHAVWGGIIWARDYNQRDKTLSISANTWESYLFKRYIWHTFATEDGLDKFDVVRRVMQRMRADFSAGADIENDFVTPVPENSAVDIYVLRSLTSGTTQASKTYLREEMKSFGEMLTDYADNLGGFEWFFQYTYNENMQRFRRRIILRDTPPSLMKKGQPEPEDTEEDKPGIDTYQFQSPGNIMNLSLSEDASNACTRQFVVGGPPRGVTIEGFKPIGAWNNTEYLDAGFPLVENVESSKHSSMSNQLHLERMATVYGRESAPPIRTWSVQVNGSMDPIFGTYKLGDWCRLIIDDTFILQSLAVTGDDINRGVAKRIIGMSVEVPDTGGYPDTVTLEFEDDVIVSFEEADE